MNQMKKVVYVIGASYTLLTVNMNDNSEHLKSIILKQF